MKSDAMKTSPRWIAAVTKEAAALSVSMPWERGARRKETIAARKEAVARARARIAALQGRPEARMTA